MNGQRTEKRQQVWIYRGVPHRWLVLAGLCVGFAIRLHGLGVESLWYDEAVSAFLARQSVTDLVAHTARDIHPPGYYLLLHLWHQLVQPTLDHGLEFLYAWPSVAWGMLLLPLVYILGLFLFDPKTALLAVWLSAIHPYHVWYSQEVRMYTMAAVLGLLAFWATLRWVARDHRQSPFFARYRWLVLFAVVAAAGLYTLYYFAFLLTALNIVVFLWLATRDTWHQLGDWLLAQVGALLLWAPWLPIAWKQVVDPAVPAWRDVASTMDVARESFAALLVGQTPPMGALGLWAAAALLLLIGSALLYTRHSRLRNLAPLFAYTFVPLLVIYLLTISIVPLYHIRYFFVYAAPTSLLVAAGIRSMAALRPVQVGALSLILLASGWGLAEFWTNPLYRADDHRSAVAALASAWRPGDLILVNAGWVYPVLDIYWPDTWHDPHSSRPESTLVHARMTGDDLQSGALLSHNGQGDQRAVVILRGGSVDGPPTLGWNLVESDFYSVTEEEIGEALEKIASTYARIWHYRLYDTVSDPQGTIRAWLADHTALQLDRPFPGRDFLRLQRYLTASADDPRNCPQIRGMQISFAGSLSLIGWDAEFPATAGETLYLTACFRVESDLGADAGGLKTSLRLYGQGSGDTVLVAQQDESIPPPMDGWIPGALVRLPLALPLEAALPPGSYRLQLLLYDGANNVPLPIEHAQAADDQQLALSDALPVRLPPTPPPAGPFLALFDYIELLEVGGASTAARPGDRLDLSMLWRPRPNGYQDTYRGVFTLQSASAKQTWTTLLGGPHHPSGDWPPSYPVQQRTRLALPSDLPAGDYTLTIQLERAGDGLPIPARRTLPWQSAGAVRIGTVTITE